MYKAHPPGVGWLLLMVPVIALTGCSSVAQAQAESASKKKFQPVAFSEAPLATQMPSTTHIDTAASAVPDNGDSRLVGGSVASVGLNARNEKAGPHMKCWQHGRLIVDKLVTVMPAQAQSTNGRVRDGDTGAEVIAFDLQNAMCLIQK